MTSARLLLSFLVLAPVACGSSSGVAAGPSPSASAPPAPPPASAPSCSPTAATDIQVASDNLNAFPPYAVSGCSLVYVATSGALVLRDLAGGGETTLAPPEEKASRPAIAGDLVAWESRASSASVVRVRAGTETRTLGGAFAMAGEPRVTDGAVAFTAWQTTDATSDTDVWLWDRATGASALAIGGAGQQRFADVSKAFVVASDFAEDPDGRYDGNDTDVADLTVLDRASGAITTRKRAGKQAFPMLTTTNLVVYLDWAEIHPEPKFQAFQLRGGAPTADPSADWKLADVVNTSGTLVRPATFGATVEWIDDPAGSTTLLRAPADGSTAPAAVSGLDHLVLYAPAPAASFTVLATTETGASARLRAVPRTP